MKDLVFQTIFPDDNFFLWQAELLITNLIELGYTCDIEIIICKPVDRVSRNPNFQRLEAKFSPYKNVKFFWYHGDHKLRADTISSNYIPLLRPYCAAKHYAKYPQLKEKAIFYIDSDILLTKYLDFTPFLNDEVNYTSQAGGYNNVSYWDSKKEQVLEDKKELYNNFDILEVTANLCGATRELAQKYNDHTGAAQYLLKNVDASFWQDVYDGCIAIRKYLMPKNIEFFGSEDKGFQSWCADIWAVNWNLWRRGADTVCPKELDFAWATDPISKIDNTYIFHNAGVSSEVMGDKTYFFKGKYVSNSSPHRDNVNVSTEFCSSWYYNKLKEIKNPIF